MPVAGPAPQSAWVRSIISIFISGPRFESYQARHIVHLTSDNFLFMMSDLILYFLEFKSRIQMIIKIERRDMVDVGNTIL